MIISHFATTAYNSIAKAGQNKNLPADGNVSNEENNNKTALSKDFADISVSAKMTSRLHGLRAALDNISRGRTMINIADGYVEETQNIVQKIRALAVKSVNSFYTDEDRQQFQVQVSALVDEVDRLASQGEYNNFKLLTGEFFRVNGKASMWFHIGPNMNQRERIFISTMTAQSLHLRSSEERWRLIITVSTVTGANSSIEALDYALWRVTKQRADLGAYSDRMKHSAEQVMRSINTILKSGEVSLDKEAAEDLKKTINKLELMK
ncbi:MAG: flagellin [bacterium]|nr:flagellin [bacterium]